MNTQGLDGKCNTPKSIHENFDAKSVYSQKSKKSENPFTNPPESQTDLKIKALENSVKALEERFDIIMEILKKEYKD